jgi:hypothetical protein
VGGLDDVDLSSSLSGKDSSLFLIPNPKLMSFTPSSRATRAIDFPDLRHNATASRLNSSEYRLCLEPLDPIPTSSSIPKEVSGHKGEVQCSDPLVIGRPARSSPS